MFILILVWAFFAQIIAISIPLFIAGIALLISCHSEKKKGYENSHKKRVAGIILTSIGGIILLFGITGFANSFGDNPNDEYTDFFTKHVKTDVIAEGNFADRFINGFSINGEHYIYVAAMEVKYLDEDRGDAVANLENHTIFEYNNNADCRMLCFSDDVFCHKDDADKLMDYYTNLDGTIYGYAFYDHRDGSDGKTHHGQKDIDDEMFDTLHDTPESEMEIVDKIDKDFNFQIHQLSADGEFKRYISLAMDEDDIYMVVRSHNFQTMSYDYNTYHITDEKLYNYWYDFMLEDIENEGIEY